MWKREFKSQAYNIPTKKHIELPLYETYEFDFYRCVQFEDSFYYKTVSELHSGNLRYCSGRYSKLFPNQKLSYWANSAKTARAEVKKHGATNNLITFCAYDDTSSFLPTTANLEDLLIVDGRKCGIQKLIDKVDENKEITEKEKKLLDRIMSYMPDCLVFDSHAVEGGENFIFFEQGFKKLSLREVRLRLGDEKGKNHNGILCAIGCDYSPCLEAYGEFFAPLCKVKMNKDYLNSNEYKSRNFFKNEKLKRLRK